MPLQTYGELGQPQKQGELFQVMDCGESQLDQLDKNVEVLTSKLSLLLKVRGSEQECPARPDMGSSGAVCRLFKMVERIEEKNRILQDLIDRLEV